MGRVREQSPDEIFASVRDFRRSGEFDLFGAQDGPRPEDVTLRHAMSEGSSSEEHLEEDDSRRPDVYLRGNARRSTSTRREAFRGQVPVRPRTRRRQLDVVVACVRRDLGESEVGDLNLASVDEQVRRLEVVMDNGLFCGVENLQARKYLDHHTAGLFLGKDSVGLQERVEVFAF